MKCSRCGGLSYETQFFTDLGLVTGVSCPLCGNFREIFEEDVLPIATIEIQKSIERTRQEANYRYLPCTVPGCNGHIEKYKNKSGLCQQCKSKVLDWSRRANGPCPIPATHLRGDFGAKINRRVTQIRAAA